MSIEMWMSHLRTPAECYVNKPLLFEKINTSPKTLRDLLKKPNALALGLTRLLVRCENKRDKYQRIVV